MKLNKITKWMVAGVCLAVVTLTLVGCQHKKEQTVKPAAPKVTRVDFAVDWSVDSLPFYVAASQGYFKQHHLDVSLKSVDTDLNRLNGIKANQYAGAVMGLPELLANGGDKPTVRVVGTTTDYVSLLTTDNDITQLKQVQDQTVGTIANSTQAYALHLLLNQNKVPEDAVTITTMPDEAALQTALTGQSISAATLTDPTAISAQHQGARKLGQTAVGQMNNGIVFSNDVIKHQSSDVKAFIDAYNEAVNYINAHPASSQYQDVLVNHLGYPSDNLDAVALPHFKKSSAVSSTSLGAIHQWLLDNNSGMQLAPVSQYLTSIK